MGGRRESVFWAISVPGASYHVYPRTLDRIPHALHDPWHCAPRQDHSARRIWAAGNCTCGPARSRPNDSAASNLQVDTIVCNRLESVRTECRTFLVNGPTDQPAVVAWADANTHAGVIETFAANGLPSGPAPLYAHRRHREHHRPCRQGPATDGRSWPELGRVRPIARARAAVSFDAPVEIRSQTKGFRSRRRSRPPRPRRRKSSRRKTQNSDGQENRLGSLFTGRLDSGPGVDRTDGRLSSYRSGYGCRAAFLWRLYPRRSNPRSLAADECLSLEGVVRLGNLPRARDGLWRAAGVDREFLSGEKTGPLARRRTFLWPVVDHWAWNHR